MKNFYLKTFTIPSSHYSETVTNFNVDMRTSCENLNSRHTQAVEPQLTEWVLLQAIDDD